MRISLLLYLYLTFAFFYNLYWRKSKSVTEWVPREYRDEFSKCGEGIDSLFDIGEEIPREFPTLLILGNVLTRDKGLLLLDCISNFLTFGLVRFNEIIPVGKPLSLTLYFKNISRGNLSVQRKMTKYYIKYPGEISPSRTWRIDIPSLPNPEDIRFVNSELFFCPEVPGTHEFGIVGFKDLVYAGPYGMSGRMYRIPNPGVPWLFRFHVSSGYEYRVFIIAFIALAVAITSLILTLIEKM